MMQSEPLRPGHWPHAAPTARPHRRTAARRFGEIRLGQIANAFLRNVNNAIAPRVGASHIENLNVLAAEESLPRWWRCRRVAKRLCELVRCHNQSPQAKLTASREQRVDGKLRSKSKLKQDSS
jgi:hypothetical protein